MLDGMQELHLVQAVKETLRENICADHRTALDPRNQDYDIAYAKRITENLVMEYAMRRSELTVEGEEKIEYMVRFMRDMPRLLDETVTADNMPEKTDA